ncbi:hypothetical protein E2C01_029609 [Portunus trituberculatus]|uniref:Uncharacterized protein n=1 Tax=Portunus trituberculatus TaxID=210409 RepID=A0A5B7ENU5_PORTR|nr:hypothetical protein [Portunus trituberculatus]
MSKYIPGVSLGLYEAVISRAVKAKAPLHPSEYKSINNFLKPGYPHAACDPHTAGLRYRTFLQATAPMVVVVVVVVGWHGGIKAN